MNNAENLSQNSGCGGPLAAKIQGFVEAKLLHQGSITEYLEGSAKNLTFRARRELMDKNSAQLMNDVVFPAFMQLSEDSMKQNLKGLVNIWITEDDVESSQKREDLYHTAAFGVPHSADQWDMEDELSIQFLKNAFSVEEHFEELDKNMDGFFSEPDRPIKITAIRRMVRAIKLRFKDEELPQEWEENEKIERIKDNLMKLFNEKRITLPFPVKRDMAETIFVMNSTKDWIPNGIEWMCLSSEDQKIAGRVIIDYRNAFSEFPFFVSSKMAENIRKTPADSDHKLLWKHFNQLIYTLGVSPTEELTLGLRRRLENAFNGEQTDPESIGEICGTLDTLLRNPQSEEQRDVIIFPQNISILIFAVLDSYDHSPYRMDIHKARTQMINLAETLTRLYPEEVKKEEIKILIDRIIRQYGNKFPPARIVMGADRGGLRLSAQMAAEKLADTAGISYE